ERRGAEPARCLDAAAEGDVGCGSLQEEHVDPRPGAHLEDAARHLDCGKRCAAVRPEHGGVAEPRVPGNANGRGTGPRDEDGRVRTTDDATEGVLAGGQCCGRAVGKDELSMLPGGHARRPVLLDTDIRTAARDCRYWAVGQRRDGAALGTRHDDVTPLM